MSRWLKEPLVHFLLLGAAIFLLYYAVAGPGGSAGTIVISKGQQENLINTFARTWQRAPTPEEFHSLLQDYIRQEIAYRESKNMGLDQDDIVIRRRLRQKLELLIEDLASLAPPTDEQLQHYLQENTMEFILDPRLSLRQIYISTDRRGSEAQQDALALLQQIKAAGPDVDVEVSGDPIPLPASMDDLREAEVARLFGTVFTEGLQGQETGRWIGPIESGFGLHLVYIDERIEGRVPELDEVRDTVQREWMSQRRRDSVDGLYNRLAENYSIEIEPLILADVQTRP